MMVRLDPDSDWAPYLLYPWFPNGVSSAMFGRASVAAGCAVALQGLGPSPPGAAASLQRSLEF